MTIVAQIGGWFATLARAIVIGIVAVLCLIAYGVGCIARLCIRDRSRRDQHRARQRGRLLRWSLARLGATFIKIGQILSTRPDLFAPSVIDELRWLQDHVPPFAFDDVRRIVERETRGPIANHFRSFDEVSVAAGSVAQVHHAVLLTGEEVAVKVVRPNVLARVRRDGRILLWVAHAAHAISRRARTANFIGHTRAFVAGILAQVDLRLEHVNYERFRKNFASTPGLGFPRVYAALSTRHMLTMEYIHGARIEEASAEHLPEAARVIRSMFFAMCFDHGLVHADLHPGNVLIDRGGKVIILDVGLVKRISRELLPQVVDFTRCIAIGTAQDLVDHLSRYHHYLGKTDWSAVRADAEAFLSHVRAKPLAQLELSSVVRELFALAHKHQIRPMPEMTLVLLGMVTSEGMAKRLDPDVDTVAELAKHLMQRVEPRRRLARGSRDWDSPPLEPDAQVEPVGGPECRRRHPRSRRRATIPRIARPRARLGRPDH